MRYARSCILVTPRFAPHGVSGLRPFAAVSFICAEQHADNSQVNDVTTYFLGLYEKSMPDSRSLKEKLIETKRAGFDFMEISIDETDEKLGRLQWSANERLELVRAMSETGCRIMTMCLSGHRKFPLGCEEEEKSIRSIQIMAEAIDLAVDLGIRIIQIAGYDEYYLPSTPTTRRLFLENLRRSVDMASKKGVNLAFETMETEFMNTVGKAMHYVDTLQSPYLQVYPDLGNITNAALQYGTSVTADLQSARGHLAAMHLKESLPGKFREIPYGTGHVNFLEGIRAARECGVNLFVGEFWYVGNHDWQEQLVQANSFLRGTIQVAARSR
jgi:L-ribulose-5-phosphate 3-epimerase